MVEVPRAPSTPMIWPAETGMLVEIQPVPDTPVWRSRVVKLLVVVGQDGGAALRRTTATFCTSVPTSVGTRKPVMVKAVGAVNQKPRVSEEEEKVEE